MAKQKQINWFGKTNKPINKKKNQFSFLGLPQAKKTNYLGLTGKYGDKDMDGSPNVWDCSPKNPGKDGLLARALGVVTGGLAGQSKATYNAERLEKRKGKPSVYQKIKAGYTYAQNPIKAIHKQQEEKIYKRKVGAVEANIKRIEEAGENKKEKRRAEKALRKSLVSLDVAQYQKRLKGVQEKQAKEKRVMGGIKKYAGAVLGEQVMKGQILSSPAIKVRPDRYNLRRQQTARAAQYSASPYQQSEIQRIKTEISKRNLGGRPAGTYTHSIPGVGPVHVYVWRKWMRQQKAMARLRASQIQPQEQTQMQPGQQMQNFQMSPEEAQAMQQYQMEQQQMMTNPELEAQTIDQLPAENKFTKNLQMLQAAYQREQYNRLVNEQPKGFVQQGVRQRQMLQQQQREFSRRNSLLHAHKAMLTPQENAIDFLNTSGNEVNLLDTRNNNIMARQPNSIDINNTNRPNVLETENRNPLQADRLNFGATGENILNDPRNRLNFGKVNLTDEEGMI